MLLFLNDTPVYAAVFFGAVRVGFVPILINTFSPRDLIRFYLEDAAAKVAVVDAEYAALFDAAVVHTKLHTLIAVNGTAPTGTAVTVREGDRWFAEFPAKLESAPTARDDMAFWMYSSGSTGRPKGIVHLQHDMAYTVASFARHILAVREDDICFSVPKIFFAYGFGNSMTFPFAVGASAVLHAGRPEPGAVLDVIARFRPTLFFGLPTLYNALLNHAGIRSANLSSVRLCLSAAEVLSQELFDGWKQHFGQEIIEGLGSTEVLHDQKKVGCAGKRVPGYEIRLTTPQRGTGRAR